MTPEQVHALVPQQAPFRFLDRLVSVDREQAIGEYTFKADEFFYQGHFPGDPVTPGVILLETMCQTGLVALGIYLLGLEHPEEVSRIVTLFTDAQVEFERVVRPGETVRVVASPISWRRKKLRSSVQLFVADGPSVARGTVSGMGVLRHG